VGHLLNPSSVPSRANIFALKQLGVTRIIASGAVGSLREAIAPRDLVLPDQAIDRTFRRPGTFFEGWRYTWRWPRPSARPCARP